MVAPITKAGVITYKVYLPSYVMSTEKVAQTRNSSGADQWRDWWTDEPYKGGEYISIEATIDRIPVFYRGTKHDIFSGKLYRRCRAGL